MQSCDASVIIPAYNAANFVVDALDSIARQTLLPREVIVINDGSTDKTSAIVQAWIDRQQSSYPVYLVNQTNKGLPATRNVGIRRAVGKWISLLDADDVWEPGHLWELFRGAELLPLAVAAYGAGRLLVENVVDDRLYDDFWDNPSRKFGKPIPDSPCFEIDSAVLPRLIRGNFIKPSSLMFVKAVASDIGLFNEGLRTAEDREFLVRLIHKGVFVYNSLPITQYRWHGDNISQPKNAKRNLENALRALQVISHSMELKLSDEALAACRTETKELIKGYLFSCSQLGWRGYVSGFRFIADLCGQAAAINGFNPKDLVRCLVFRPRDKVKQS